MYNPLIEDHHTIDPAQNSKSPFFGIFILDSNSGVELVSHSYSPTRVDLDVNAISGMFKALELFINNMAYSNQFESVQEINFQGLRIVYERYGPVDHQILCVGVSRKVISTKKEHYVLKAIVRDFFESYRQQLMNFQGEVKYFENFYPVLANIPAYFSKIIPYYNPGYASSPQSSISRPIHSSRHLSDKKVAGSSFSTHSSTSSNSYHS
ncbi:MAG: hypothetical protein ACTSYI_14340 [Promethearchaeota archaeon]